MPKRLNASKIAPLRPMMSHSRPYIGVKQQTDNKYEVPNQLAMFDFSKELPISVRRVATMVPSRLPRNVADHNPVRIRTKSACVTPGMLNWGSSSCVFPEGRPSVVSSEYFLRSVEGLAEISGVRSVAADAVVDAMSLDSETRLNGLIWLLSQRVLIVDVVSRG